MDKETQTINYTSAMVKELLYKKLIKKLNSANIILLGEIHNNPIVHWLTLEISKSLNVKKQFNSWF